VVVLALAGCGRGIWDYMEREPWRAEAEAACLSSGAVKEGPTVVRIAPIEGPGICGADYPLKVAALGDNAALGFAGEPIRPPGSIPGMGQGPRWPIATTRPVPPAAPAAASMPMQNSGPLSLTPPGVDQQFANPQRPSGYASPSAPMNADSVYPRGSAVPPEEEFDDEESSRMPQRAPVQRAPMQSAPVPPLGPQRAPQVTGSVVPVGFKPTATLACPMVSALDRWIANSLQPAAQRWFGQQVVEIKQISAYSCRGMNGQPGAKISEHAFGNALDIAAFELADGRRITVKDGWRGTPEEQGFLRDVQAAACEQFTTVLAPGSNRFHYDHFHFDLMRRASGRRICQPGAVDGELIASRARRDPMVASRPDAAPGARPAQADPRNDPFAWRGAKATRSDPVATGSIKSAGKRGKPFDDDDDWVEDEGPRPAIDWGSERRRRN
jgi:hypothetical protein